jgi:hypothetical protein
MRKTKIGLPISQPKNKSQDEKVKDVILKKNVLIEDTEKFNASSVRSNAIPFDNDTGIISNSPEILFFSSFEPAYNDEGLLNKTGEILQAKQESLFISANKSLKDVIDSSIFTDIQSYASGTRDEIKEFCDNFIADSNDLIAQMENIRKNLDPLYPNLVPYDDKGKVDLNAALKEYPGGIDVFPKQVGNVIGDEDTIKFWTSTKVWLQMCREVKEILARGYPSNLLSNSTSVKPVINSSYKNPYKLTPANSANIKKFTWNKKTFISPSINDVAILAKEGFDNAVDSYKVLFSKNIFSSKIFSNSDSFEESIGRLAYLLCKEHVYSSKMMKNSSFAAQYGYDIGTRTDAINIWDYIIGSSGADITDISSSPLGNGNSLVSIAQTADNGSEILTFEDRYITDDVGLKRQGTVITPGMYYYVESSLNTVNNTFDTTRIDSLLSKLNTAESTFKIMLESMVFKLTPSSVSSPSGEGKNQTIEARNRAINSIKNYNKTSTEGELLGLVKMLSNPIDLVRKIENEILAESPLMNRGVVTAEESKAGESVIFGPMYTNLLWSRDVDGVFITNSANKPTDISWLLISLAADDTHLKTLIFMRTIATLINQLENVVATKEVQEYTGDEFGYDEQGNVVSNPQVTVTKDITIKTLLSEAIIKRIIEITSTQTADPNSFNASVYINDVKDALDGVIPKGLEMLDNIVNVMKQIDINNWFMTNSTGNQGDINNTFYSGIPKSTYYAAFFELCMLMIHAANPERIMSYSDSYYGCFSTKKVNQHVISGFKQNSGEIIAVYQMDKILSACEKMIYEQIKYVRKSTNTAYALIKNLKKQFSSYKDSLASGKFSVFLASINSTLKNSSLSKYLLTKEQLQLVNSCLKDTSNRCSLNYSSPLKEVAPYFYEIKDNPDLDLILPLEDIHLPSWNFWLKNFLNEGRFRQSEGFNKKIISIGIPPKLQRRLQISASSIVSKTNRKSLIKLRIYRYDMLKPDLVHLPKTLLFDFELFNSKLLSTYTADPATIQSQNPNISPEDPEYNSKVLKSLFADKTVLSAKYDFLPTEEKIILFNSHYESFLFELYLKFISDSSFDEQKYYRYSQLPRPPDNLGILSQVSSRTSFNKFFINHTFMAKPEDLKSDLISPRKFDRVYHTIIDPDDFTVDLNLTSPDVFQKYLSKGDVINSANGSYVRKKTDVNEITFDKYFVSIESYGESATAT